MGKTVLKHVLIGGAMSHMDVQRKAYCSSSHFLSLCSRIFFFHDVLQLVWSIDSRLSLEGRE